MTKTQPIEHLELTLGPATVFSLAVALRQPPPPPVEVHPQFGSRSPQSPGGPRWQNRLFLVVPNGETAH